MAGFDRYKPTGHSSSCNHWLEQLSLMEVNARMNLERRTELLSGHPVIGDTGPEALRQLAEGAELQEVVQGETVIEEGESLRHLYFVAQGRLEKLCGTEEGGKDKTITQVQPNESFGNMVLVTEAPSWCSVRAVTDSLLLRIDRDNLVSLIRETRALNREISSRLGTLIKSGRDRTHPAQGEIISLCSPRSRVGKSMLGINLAAILQEETEGRVALVDFTEFPESEMDESIVSSPGAKLDWFNRMSTDHQGNFDIFSVHPPEQVTGGAVKTFLETLVEQVQFAILVLPAGFSEITEKLIDGSDQVYLLTTGDEEVVYESRLMLSDIEEILGGTGVEPQVLLNRVTDGSVDRCKEIADHIGRSIQYQLPEIEEAYAEDFLEREPYVHQKPEELYSRIVHRISHQAGGTTLGLALGSGAARGLAHIGVLEVFDEEDFEPDMVAGSSMGAIIAAGYALGFNANRMKEMAEKFREIGGFFKIRDLSVPPTRSILRSDRIRSFLSELFGESRFSDTEIPLRVVTSDLVNAREHVFSSGKIKDAVLASISIPMIFEPRQHNGQTFVDGGVLQPVPVETLSGENVDRIVAVNPIPPNEVLQEQHPERFPGSRDGDDTNSFLKSFFPVGEGNLIDTGMRTIEMIESRYARRSSERADVVIDPYLAELSWFDFDELDTFIKQGRLSAREKIDRLKELSHNIPRETLEEDVSEGEVFGNWDPADSEIDTGEP